MKCPKLTLEDLKLWRGLCVCLALDQKKQFTADDIYEYGFNIWFTDPSHGIGNFFRKLQHNKLAVHVGYTVSQRPSNNHREIKTWLIKDG